MAVDVPGIISEAQSMAKSLADSAKASIDSSLKAFDTRTIISPSSQGVSLNFSPFKGEAAPEFPGAAFRPPKEPGGAPTTRSIPNIDVGGLAPGSEPVKPTVSEPNKPTALTMAVPNAPALSVPDVPDMPSLLRSFEFEPPKLTDVVIPAAPKVSVPAFTATKPNLDLSAPEGLEEKFRHDFADQSASLRSDLESAVDAQLTKINPRFHEQMSAIETRLAKYVEGGTALAPHIETAIWERGAEKNTREYLRVRDAAYQEGAGRGFTIPSGAQFSAAVQARQAAADNNARMAVEIAIKQAELEQQNLQWAVTQSAGLRQMVLASTQQWAGTLVQLNGHALEFAKGVLNSVVALYDIRVKMASAQVEVYKSEAMVFESLLRATLAEYEVYQAQVSALKAQVSVDEAKVQAFSARMNGLSVMANAYKAAVDSVVAKAQIEKFKVDIFGAQVQAYSAALNGKNAEWEAYKAQLQGNSEKWRAYQAETQGYAEKVRAWQVHISAQGTAAEAVSMENRALLGTYDAQVKAYNSLVDAEATRVKTDVLGYEAELKGYVATQQGRVEEAKANYERVKATGEMQISKYRVDSELVMQNTSLEYKRMSDAAQVILGGANSYAQMAGSALAGMNSLAAAIESKTL